MHLENMLLLTIKYKVIEEVRMFLWWSNLNKGNTIKQLKVKLR